MKIIDEEIEVEEPAGPINLGLFKDVKAAPARRWTEAEYQAHLRGDTIDVIEPISFCPTGHLDGVDDPS